MFYRQYLSEPHSLLPHSPGHSAGQLAPVNAAIDAWPQSVPVVKAPNSAGTIVGPAFVIGQPISNVPNVFATSPVAPVSPTPVVLLRSPDMFAESVSHTQVSSPDSVFSFPHPVLLP
jgi:hypothetical protein